MHPKTPDGIFVDRDRDKKEAATFHFWFSSGVILVRATFSPMEGHFYLGVFIGFGNLVMV